AAFGPEYLLTPIWAGQASVLELGRRLLIVTAAWGSVVIGCLGLAGWRLRAASMDRPVFRRRDRSARRPAVAEMPTGWKERYCEQRLPLAFVGYIPKWLYLLGVPAGTASLMLWIYWPGGTAFTALGE